MELPFLYADRQYSPGVEQVIPIVLLTKDQPVFVKWFHGHEQKPAGIYQKTHGEHLKQIECMVPMREAKNASRLDITLLVHDYAHKPMVSKHQNH